MRQDSPQNGIFICFLRPRRRISSRNKPEIRERLGAIARFHASLKYCEPFVVKVTMRVDDITAMGVRSL